MFCVQRHKTKAIQYGSDIYRETISVFDIGFYYFDLTKRSELISFRNYSSLSELADSIENGDELRDSISKCLKSHDCFSLILKMKNIDNYVKCRGSSFLKNGVLTGVMIVFEDISYVVNLNNRTEIDTRNILQSKQYYADILNFSPYLIWEIKNDVEVGYANQSYLKHFGLRNIGNDHKSNSYKHIGLNGEIRVFSITSKKHNKSIFNFAHDITELHNTKNDLNKSLQIQKCIVENLNIPIAYYNKNMEISFYNNPFTHFYNLEKSWLNKRPTYEEVCKRCSDKVDLMQKSNLSSNRIFQDIIDVSVFFVPIKNSKKRLQIIAIPGITGLWFIYETIQLNT